MAATGHAAVCPDQYQAAITKLQQGLFEEAANKFEIIYQDLLTQQVPASHLAMTQYNRGLAFSQQASQTESPEDQLLLNKQAQSAFLLAKRWQPTLQQASGHLDYVAINIANIQATLAAQLQAQQQQADQMHELINLIEALLENQISIRQQLDENPFMQKN